MIRKHGARSERERQEGFGLAELLVGVALTALVLLGAYKVFVGAQRTTVRAAGDQLLDARLRMLEAYFRTHLMNAGQNPRHVGFKRHDHDSYNGNQADDLGDEVYCGDGVVPCPATARTETLRPFGINGAWRHALRYASDLDQDGQLRLNSGGGQPAEVRSIGLRGPGGLFLDGSNEPAFVSELEDRPQALCTLRPNRVFENRFELVEREGTAGQPKVLTIGVLCLEIAYFRSFGTDGSPRPEWKFNTAGNPTNCTANLPNPQPPARWEAPPFMTALERQSYAYLRNYTADPSFRPDTGLPYAEDGIAGAANAPGECGRFAATWSLSTENDLFAVSRVRLAVVLESDRPNPDRLEPDVRTGRRFPVERREWAFTLNPSNRAKSQSLAVAQR